MAVISASRFCRVGLHFFIHLADKPVQLPVKFRIPCRKAVGVFRQTAALCPLLGNHITVERAKHRGGHGWLWLFFLAEYAEKSFPLWLLRLFLHTFLHDYRYLPCNLLVEDLLLVKHLNNPGASAAPYLPKAVARCLCSLSG